ncbi:MAG: polyprenyl synthetase family protein [Paracoccaceae bacterium]|nr:polyprenyl synthetase family protein [Paracoccaceae bacterium]
MVQSVPTADADPVNRLTAILADDLAAVDRVIRSRMESEHARRVGEVATHVIDAGGKRLRPLFTLAAARLCGYAGDAHIGLAATVELIHTATLLHDDVVDESLRRRGRPTANRLWDNKSSVLVGDYLFSRSFQLMVESESLRILGILADAAATIAEGEVLQLTASRSLATDEPTYLKVIRGKTAALFSAATEVGAVVAGAPEPVIAGLRDFGDAFGMSFQITDDILDYTGSAEILKKDPGDDFRASKLTLPVIKAAAHAGVEERAFWTRVIELGDQREDDLEVAMRLFDRHGALESSRQDARRWSDVAHSSLGAVPESPVGLRALLADLAKDTVSRLT